MTSTREAVRKGFYIRPFAEHEVRLRSLELPPLMWIFEWDMVGGWHSLLSLVYRGSGDEVAAAIEEGNTAASTVRRAHGNLRAALRSAGPHTCGQPCADALRSLEYQETLFEALTAWRQAFLSHYKWLETGDRNSWIQWTTGRQRFGMAASDHLARFNRDLNFPAFDLSSARRAASVAARATWARSAAGLILIAAIATMLLATLPVQRQPAAGAWAGCVRFAQTACRAAAPWRLAPSPPDWRWSIGVVGVAFALVVFLVGALTGFTSAWPCAAPLIIFGTVAFVFEVTASGVGDKAHGQMVAVALRPVIPGLLLLIALITYLDPMGFWYRFWLSKAFRIGILTVLLAMPLWTMLAALAGPPPGSRRVIGALLASAGAALLVLTILLPPWVNTLRALDAPLNIAPATETMLFALRTYVGVSLGAGPTPWIAGGLLLVAGYAIRRSPRTCRRRFSRPSTVPCRFRRGTPHQWLDALVSCGDSLHSTWPARCTGSCAMRVSRSFPINLPVEQIDMYRWVTGMTSADYESFTPAHKALGSYFRDSRFFMVNVECIGTDLLVQHYELIDHSPSHVRFHSRRTKAYVYRWLPVTLSVPWEMRVRPTSARSCELTCTIGADFPSAILGALARLNGSFFFMKRHLEEEGAAFARHLERTFAD